MTASAIAGSGAVTILDSVDSTNDAVRRRLAEGATDPFVIAARQQTKGRGRSGRVWRSPEGNLAVTFYFPFDGSWQDAARLSFAVSLGVRDAVSALAPGTEQSLKWPNDVLLNGRKVCGILLENIGKDVEGRLQILIGIGLNLASHPDPAEANWTPTSILAETGNAPSFEAALDQLVSAVPARLYAERALGFAETRRNWLARAVRLGTEITVRLQDQSFSGIFREIDDTGALVLETASGIRTVTAGDVFFPKEAGCS